MQLGKHIGFRPSSKDDRVFSSAEDKVGAIEGQIDSILNENPSELKKVAENLTFIQDVQNNNVPKGRVVVDAFGVEKFDLADILKENIWDRSIFTTDTICRMFLNANIEQLKKYLPKKTKIGFQYWWLVILLIVGGVAVMLILFFLLPKLASIKLF